MSNHVHCCDEVDAEAAWGAGYNAGRFDLEAPPLTREPGLDVERLARALHQLQSEPHRDRYSVAGEGRDTCDLDAAVLAREYVALASEDRP